MSDRIVLTVRRSKCRCRLAVVARAPEGLRIRGSVTAPSTGADGHLTRVRRFFDVPLTAEACPIDLSCHHGGTPITAVAAFGAVHVDELADAARRAGGDYFVD